MTLRQGHTIAAAAALAATLLLAGCSGSSTSAAPAKTLASPAAEAGGRAGASSASAASTAPPAATSSPATASAASACALITETEVRTALGADPGKGSPFSSHGASQCQYGSYQTAFVLVNLNPTMGKAAYDHMRTNPKISEAGAVADIGGVGDRAFGISGHNTASVYINTGDALVLVMVEIRSATSPPTAQARALAAIAAGRL